MQPWAENTRRLDPPLRIVIAGCGAVTRLYMSHRCGVSLRAGLSRW